MAEPIDGQVVHDDHEPGGERAGRIGVGGTATEASEIVLTQGFAHPREDVHDFVGFHGIVSDRAEDEAAVALDEEIPRSLGITRRQPSAPLNRSRLVDARVDVLAVDIYPGGEMSRVSEGANRRALQPPRV